MRKAFALFLFSSLVFQFAFAGDDPGAAMEWDFGRIKEGVVVKHDFTFKNETSGILKITGINSSCGCTVSQAGKNSLAPGESTMINVVFNSKGYLGEIKQFVYVNTDDTNMPVVRFIVKAQVEK
ncbi:MAG: DUF1573 domain-containing protein [Candidatus Omnitrophica bacterium]|nr:DUF1573 domain-containing protein [Candidatus Omnitrophota bacterium]